MKRFKVEYKTHAIIEAESFDEARAKFAETHNTVTPISFYDCETQEMKEVVGVCELSKKAIFEDDDYGYDSEGVMWLRSEEDKPC